MRKKIMEGDMDRACNTEWTEEKWKMHVAGWQLDVFMISYDKVGVKMYVSPNI